MRLIYRYTKGNKKFKRIKKLYYDKSTETVTATFECGGIKIANVAGDSGTAMISDIIKQVV